MSKIIKLFLLIIIFSCQPNDNSVIPIIQNTEVCLDDITIDEAKIGYSSQIASVRKSLNRYETGEPDWKNARNRGTYVDIPLQFKNKKAFAIGEGIDNESIKSKIKNKAVSGISIITINKTKDNKFNSYITEYIPDETLKESFNAKDFDSESEKIKNKFSGTIIRRTIEGTFLNGTIFKEGKRIKYLFEDSIASNGRAYNQMCTYNYQINYWEYSDGTIEIISTQLVSSFCVDVPDGTNGGAGGDGSNNGTGSSGGNSSNPVPRNPQTVRDAWQRIPCNTYANTLIYATPSQQKMADAHITGEQNGYLIDVNGNQIIARTDYHDGEYRILLSQAAFDLGEIYLASVLYHELTHVKHIHELSNDYLNDLTNWKNKSEYSALNAQLNFLYPYVKDRQNRELEIEYKALSSAISRLGNQYPIVKTSGYPSNPCN